jgi:hypothetical protein
VGPHFDDRLTIWAIYKHPSDYPDKWVLRGHDIGPGTVDPRPDCVVANTYKGVVAHVPPGLTRLCRLHDDDPAIYETWI